MGVLRAIETRGTRTIETHIRRGRDVFGTRGYQRSHCVCGGGWKSGKWVAQDSVYFVGEDEGWRMRARDLHGPRLGGHWPVDESRRAVTTGGSVAEPFWKGVSG